MIRGAISNVNSDRTANIFDHRVFLSNVRDFAVLDTLKIRIFATVSLHPLPRNSRHAQTFRVN